jgi:hypothetical protein
MAANQELCESIGAAAHGCELQGRQGNETNDDNPTRNRAAQMCKYLLLLSESAPGSQHGKDKHSVIIDSETRPPLHM